MTKLEIWNLALGEIGSVGNIVSEDDASPEARMCREAWPAALDSALAAFPWACCRREAKLAERADRSSELWSRVYQLPSDYLALRDTIPRRARYTLGNGELLTDEEAVSIVYTARIGAEKLAPHIAEVVMLKVACHAATALRVGGGALAQSLFQRGELALNQARAIEVRSGFSRSKPDRWRWA